MLLTYYTRTGKTKEIGKTIAEKLKSETDEIIDLKNRDSKLVYLFGSLASLLKFKTKILYNKKPEKHDLVVIGTPIWAGTVTPAVRTYLSENKFKTIAFFCSCDDKQNNAFKQMESLTKKPLAVLEISKKLNENEKMKKINAFCKKIRKLNKK